MQIINIVGMVLLVVGFILAGCEMVLPGFGLPGVLSLVSFIAGIYMFSTSVEQAVLLLMIILVILAVMLTIVIVFFHSSRVKSPIKLEEELGNKDGFLNSEDLAYLIGKTGITTSVLRPTGKCEIEGIIFEVRSEQGFIEKGKQVTVNRIQEKSILVRSK